MKVYHVSFILLVLAALCLASRVSAEPFKCGGAKPGPHGLGESALTNEDTIRIAVIFACGGADCPTGVDSRNWLIPPWADSLFNPNYEKRITRYFRDNSRGSLTILGDVIRRPDDDSCRYSRHIPCPYGWGDDNWCGVCPNNCNPACSSPCWCEMDSFFTDIMSQVDDTVNFADYDDIVDTECEESWYSAVDGVLLLCYNVRDQVQQYPGVMGISGLCEEYWPQDRAHNGRQSATTKLFLFT